MKNIRIVDLHCSVDNVEILKGVNLTINSGDCLALLGPNGHGKSTLINVIMGNPNYVITQGKIYLDDEDITDLSPDEKSKKGMFLGFQSPVAVPGVMSMDFFKMAINAHRENPIRLGEYYRLLERTYKNLNMDSSYAQRNLNDGFSGGEKKRNEILQMLLLRPDFAMLDEIDSGLDVDALNDISKAILECIKEYKTTFVIISHYSKLLQSVKPNRTVVIVDGKVAVDTDGSLTEKISQNGYSVLTKEYGIKIEKKEKQAQLLGTCLVKK